MPAQGQTPGQKCHCSTRMLIHVLVQMSVFHNHGLEEKGKKPFLKPFIRYHVLYQYDTTSTALGFELVTTGVL